jgi:hypothetical protein
MTIATLPRARRIGTLAYFRASIAAALGIDAHTGATADWNPLAELPPPAVDLDPAIDQALTGECLRTETDELGRWVPELYDLEPARLFDAVLLGTAVGEPFRTGAEA